MSTSRINNATFISLSSSHPSQEAEYHEISQNRALFFEKFETFHSSNTSPLKIPTFGGRPLDLHALFMEVTSRGGMEKVIIDRKWKEISSALKCPTTITSASTILKKHYESLLYGFEGVYFRKSSSSELGGDTCVVQPGSLFTGTIHDKFECGYTITVDMGSDKWHGAIFHVPSGQDDGDPITFEWGGRGFRNFQSIMFKKLQPFDGDEVRNVRRKIWLLWESLSDAQKQVYVEG